MTKFTFRLEGILAIKEKLEKQAKMDFAAAKARLNTEQDKLEQRKKERDICEEELRQLMSDMLDLKKINFKYSALDYRKEAVKQQEMAVKRASKQVDLATVRLNTAMQEKKTIEKLREKEFDEYRKLYNAEESKEVDGLVSYNYVVQDEGRN